MKAASSPALRNAQDPLFSGQMQRLCGKTGTLGGGAATKWETRGSLSDYMEPSSPILAAELCWTVMWTSTFIGVPCEMRLFVTAMSLSSLLQMFSEECFPRKEILVSGVLGKELTFTRTQR